MKFILTNFVTGEKQNVTRECVDRVKGKSTIDRLIKKVEEKGMPIEVNFEGDYVLELTTQ